MAGDLSLTVGGHELRLHPERAIELPHARTLVVADLHWGKATALRALGVPVPPGGTSDDLRRLDQVLARTGAERLLVLGDLGHSRHAWDTRVLSPVRAWRARWPGLAVTLVRGNHDLHAGDPPPALAILAVPAPHRDGGITFAHEPHDRDAHGLSLVGHLHPSVRLAARGRQRLRLPCFVVAPSYVVLPAFSSFTGSGAWVPAPGEQAYPIADGEVLDVPLSSDPAPSPARGRAAGPAA